MRNYVVNLLLCLLASHVVTAQDLGETGKEVDLEYQTQLLAWQDAIVATDDTEDYWEYVIIRIDGLGGLEKADFLTGADVSIDVQALTDSEPDVTFWSEQKLSNFVFGAQQGNNSPEWPELGLVAYKRGSTSQLQVKLLDGELIRSDQVLLDQTLDLPAETYDSWVDYSLEADGYSLNLAVYRSITPIFSSQAQSDMNLEELLFENEDGSQASLVYKTRPGNTKAVIYFAGRADSFAQPHLLAMYELQGYDFYSLDPRYCGRARRFMQDTQYGHWIEDIDTYKEEIDYTMDFIKSQNPNYSSILAHSFSTGALISLNYAMQVQEEDPNQPEPFQGYIFTSPFLDWGHVGFWNELLLENAGLIEWAMENPLQASGLSAFHTRMWVLYRYNTDSRPIIQAHLNSGFAQAATAVQKKIMDRDTPITSTPVLLLSSRGDNTIVHTESEERMSFVASTWSSVLFDHNSHDVTASFTNALNQDALDVIREWLSQGSVGTTKAAEEEPDGILGWLRGKLFGGNN